MTMNIERYKQYLNCCDDDQLNVARARAGRFAVIGNPGSGKTRSIIARIASLVHDGLDPIYILAMTFTRQAANEMTARLQALDIKNARVGTIHSLCLDIVEQENLILGFDIETSDYKVDRRIVEVTKDLMLRGIISYLDPVPEEEIRNYISRCKATGICWVKNNPSDLNDYAVRRQLAIAEDDIYTVSPGDLMKIYRAYETARLTSKALTYDDMIYLAYNTLLVNPQIRNFWRHRYSCVIVDEQQDSTLNQWNIAYMLTGLAPIGELPRMYKRIEDDEEHNLMIAGDSAQSLYRFRHADINAFLEFSTHEDTTQLHLRNNYRSLGSICSIGSELIKGKEWHLGGKMISKVGPGNKDTDIIIRKCSDIAVEALNVIQDIENKANGNYLDFCVMSRVSTFLHIAEISCIQKRIPYEKRSGKKNIFQFQALKNILSYLYVGIGCDPDGSNFKRAVNSPYRFIKRADLDQIVREFQAEGKTMEQGPGNDWAFHAVNRLMGRVRSSKQRMALMSFKQLLKELRRDNQPPKEQLQLVFDKSGILNDSIRRREAESTEMIIKDFVLHFAGMFTQTFEFLGYIDRLGIAVKNGTKEVKSNQGNRLVLTTCHGAKGLEWDHVYLCDVVADRMPHVLAQDMDEELRIFYVALTRAAKTINVSYSVGECVKSEYISLLNMLKLGKELQKDLKG